jgi:hypothetical protein
MQPAAGRARIADFELNKRSQPFIRVHNVTLSVAMRVSNEDCSPARVHGCDAAPTPTGFAEIVSDDFPVFHANHCVDFGLRKAKRNAIP